jgi:hypothetical protein
MRVVSGNLGYNQRTYDAKGTDCSENCPYGGDPIEVFGDPKLSRPEFALGGLVIFLGKDFSDNGLEPCPIQPAACHLLNAGCAWGLRLPPGGRADDLAFCLALDVAKRLPLVVRI